MESPVQRHVDEFAARNLFLQLALGALAAGARLDALLDAYAADDGPRGDTLPGDARLVDATLGLIALSRHARALLAAAARTPPTAPTPTAPARIPLR